MEKKNVKRLKELLAERMAGLIFDEYDAEELAQWLADNGVVALPVKIGQTVYCVVPPEFNDGEGEVCAWTVDGVVYKEDGKFYALDGGHEDYEINSEECCLTKEAAEEYLRKYESGEVTCDE